MRVFSLIVLAIGATSTLVAQDLNFPDGTRVHKIVGSGRLVPVGDANGDGIDDLVKINPRATPQTGNCVLVVTGAETNPPTRTVPAEGGQFCSNGSTSQEFSTPYFGTNFCGIGSNSIVFGGAGTYEGRTHRMPLTGTVDLAHFIDNCLGGAPFFNVGDVTGDQRDDLLIGAQGVSRFLFSGSGCPPSGEICGGAFFVRRAEGLAPGAVRLGDVGGSSAADLAFWSGNTVFVLFNTSHDNLEAMTSAEGLRLFSSTGGQVTAVAGDADFNADGFRDIAIGTGDASAPGLTNSGRLYLVYGRPGGFPFMTDLDQPSEHVARIEGSADGQDLGEKLAALDFDDDGIDDLVVSTSLGEIYVLFGQQARYSSTPIAVLRDAAAVISNGTGSTNGVEVASRFDFNDDGRHDVGLFLGNNYFVVFGRSNSLFSNSFEE